MRRNLLIGWHLCGLASLSLAAPSGPVCPFEDQSHCQRPTGSTSSPADSLLNVRSADDFRPTDELIGRICFFPHFAGTTDTNSGFPCNGTNGGTPPPDDWILKVYDDDFGLPGALIAGIPANGLPLTIDAKTPGNFWRYTAPVNPPDGISVLPEGCYWLEITGLGEEQVQGICSPYLRNSGDGNSFVYWDADANYDRLEFAGADLAFCLDCGVSAPTMPPSSLDGGCGDFPVACCSSGGNCTDGGTLSDCNASSQMPFKDATCAVVPGLGGCPMATNDLCINAIWPVECQNQTANPNLGTCSTSDGPPNIFEVCDFSVQSPPNHDCPANNATCLPLPPFSAGYRCQFETDNRFATTDGPTTQGGPAPTCLGSGLNAFQADIWYRYVAPCDGTMTLHNCGPNRTYDSMLQVYSNHEPTCVACPIADNTQSLACADDNCAYSSQVKLTVQAGACYTIRMGGWSDLGTPQNAGQNKSGLDLGVVCDPVYPADPPLPAPLPHDRRKNRYLSFVPNNGTKLIAFRVDKLTAPSGSCWVGPPDATGNARCTSTPTYRAWTEAVIHVGDCAVSPVADYHIVGVGTGGTANPNVLPVSTIPLPALNAKLWGDLVGTNNGLEWTPPNQFTNVNDVLAILAYISSAPIKPTFQQANLQAISSTDPCLNAFVNTADVLAAVKAVAGDPYPFTTDPATCPVCP